MKSDKKVTWFQSLGFKGTAVLVVMAVGLLVGAIWVVNTSGKRQVLEESAKLIEQAGNNAVESLSGRSAEISSLVRTIATLTENLPKDTSTYHNTFPKIFDFDGDMKVAGGGIWPEPHQFKKGVERRSFFWGRDKQGIFQYYDDYNDPAGKGYHNEEWYVVVRHTRPGRCFWSKSYMDPYSFQPMVTCTVGTYTKRKMTGTVTVDLKLEGIEGAMMEWQRKIGGYAVLFDRNGKFISFPQAGDKAKIIKTGEKDRPSIEYMTANDFAAQQPLFKPISREVTKMNQYILQEAKKQPGYDMTLAAQIDKESYQINREEAEFISAVIWDPLKDRTRNTKLFHSFKMENDFILKEKSLVYLFHVPESYWKLAIVKPVSEASHVATHLVQTLVLKIGALICVLTLFGYFLLRYFLVKPIAHIASSVQKVSALVADGKIKDIKKSENPEISKNEIGVLSQIFDDLSGGVVDYQEVFQNQKRELEIKVEEGTRKVTEVGFELKKSKRFLESLLSNMTGMVYHCRNDPDWTLEFVNDGCYDLTGYTAREYMVDRTVSFGKDVIHPDDKEMVWEDVQEALDSRNTYQLNYRVVTKNGETKWVWEQGRGEYSDDGELQYLEGVIMDISKQKEAEERLEYFATELQRSNKDLEEFAYIASHDLQEPLRKITTFGDRLRDKSSQLDDGGKDYLDRMQKAAGRMKNFIDDLLEFSRVSKSQKSFVSVDMNIAVAQVLEDLSLQIKKAEATVKVGQLPTLDGDPSQLPKIFQNLISNAIKYHKDDTAPVIEIKSTFDDKTQRWNIAVADNGIGIEEKFYDRIFKPFERLHGRNAYEGTGIGLAICEKIVSRHFGEITVTSDPEKGTTFNVFLPEKQPDEN